MKKYCSLFILTLITVCNNDSRKINEDLKIIQVGKYLSLSAPMDTYFAYNNKGNDKLFSIEGKNGFKLRGTISMYENIVLNIPITVFDIKTKDSIIQRLGANYDSTIVFFSDDVVRDVKQNIFSKEYYLYEMIDGRKGRIIQPKVIGKGFTGIILPIMNNNEKLTIYAENLDSAQHQIAMQIFRSIKFLN